jgi:hypothetical protein
VDGAGRQEMVGGGRSKLGEAARPVVACLNGSRRGSTQIMADDEPACGAHAEVAGWR